MRVEFYDYAVHEAGEVGYAVGRERGELRRGDDVLSLAIRTTRVYQWMEGRWRQVHHNGSMDDPGMLAQYQRAVAAGKRDVTPPSQRFVAEYPQVPSGKVKKFAALGLGIESEGGNRQ